MPLLLSILLGARAEPPGRLAVSRPPVGKGGERSRRQTGEWPSAGTGTLDAVSSGLCEHSLSWEAGVVWQGLGVERVVVERDVTSPWGL